MPLISLSIVSHGQAVLVQRLLSSLRTHEAASELEIILTENLTGADNGLQVKGLFPTRLVTNAKPRGFARNQNAAFDLATGDFFCVLNPDILFVEPIFARLTGLVEKGAADILAPIAVDSSGAIQDSFRPVPTPLSLLKRRLLSDPSLSPILSGEVVESDWIAALFMFMRSSTYKAVGGMDERFYLYFEDVDFCSRARLKGFQVGADTGGRVIHDAQRQSRNNLRHLLWHLQSAYRFFSSPTYRAVRAIGDKNA
jgi:GT2 family glycosyltransferase